jgi:hypothetical protein
MNSDPPKARLRRAATNNRRSGKPDGAHYWARARSAPARFSSAEVRSTSAESDGGFSLPA